MNDILETTTHGGRPGSDSTTAPSHSANQPLIVYLDGFDNGSDHPDYTVSGWYEFNGDRMTLVRAD